MPELLTLQDAFGDAAPLVSVEMYPTRDTDTAITGAGETITTHLRPVLWTGTMVIAAGTHQHRRAVSGGLMRIGAAGGQVLLGDPRYDYPADDPDGAKLGGRSLTINGISANRREVKLNGLPGGFTIRNGDRFAFRYGASPTRYALHVFVEDRTTASNGAMALTRVEPPIREGVPPTGTAVDLIEPKCKVVITDLQYGGGGDGYTGQSRFSFIQTLT